MAEPRVYRRLRTTDFLRNFSKAGLLTVRLFSGNQMKRNVEEIFFHISFECLTLDAHAIFTSNKPTHCLLDYLFAFTLFLTKYHKKKLNEVKS